MTYRYENPHPAVTTDIVVFTVRDNALSVLLIERGVEPFRGSWALPGGFVHIGESLDACAHRELTEETGVTNVYLEQLYTFGAPDRDPRERVVSVAYYALAPSARITLKAGTDARRAAWHRVEALPQLAFDHGSIIAYARVRLSAKMDYSTVGLQLMPDVFTLAELQQLYEIVSGQPRDKRNFRKWIVALGVLEKTGDKRVEGAHRPAQLFRLKNPVVIANIR